MADSTAPAVQAAGDAPDAVKLGQRAGAKKEKRRSERRGGGFLSLFGCATSRRSASPPPSSVQQSSEQQRVAAAGGVHKGNTAAVVDSPGGGSVGAASAFDQSVDPKYVYNMRHQRRGVALVFNFQEFTQELGLSYRHGSDKDTANVAAALKQLNFQVYKYNNLLAEDFLRMLRQVSEEDHSNCDAIAVVMMSHGEEGIIYASDKFIPLTDVFEPFRQCASLVGKPKLFFLQACRGSKFDSGKEQPDSGIEETEDEAFRRAVDSTDGITSIQRLPTDADFLMCYSVVPGYFSWRNGAYGSWFMQKFTEVLAETDCSKIEFMRVMTRVNRAVAYEFESRTSKPELDRKKQVPSIVSMLTKELYFPAK